MCHLTDGAQNYLSRIDSLPPVENCSNCKREAEYRIEDHPFCRRCVVDCSYMDWFRANDNATNETLGQLKPVLI